MKVHVLLILFTTGSCTARNTLHYEGVFVSGVSANANGTRILGLLDQARRMLAPGDTEFMTLAGVFDPAAQGITEGAQWAGQFWTQNGYGVGFSSLPFLEDDMLRWLQNSFRWWFDHMSDGTQTFGGIPGVPAGILCDNASPEGCNYKQCGPSRNARLSKRSQSFEDWKTQSGLGDTPGEGHDWIIEGTLAGCVMQAELLLRTRNVSGAKEFLPKFLLTSNFMEGRRVQDQAQKGLFYAGNGANLLAPSYGGWPLPVGCVVNATFSNCTSRWFASLTSLTVTYSAMLDRVIALEKLAYPHGGHSCSAVINSRASGPRECEALFQARRAMNEATLPKLLAQMNETLGGPRYLIRSIDPDGVRHGVFGAARHGYFETSPNHDAIAFRVANDSLSKEIYQAILAIPELRPCAFTLPNYPDYDDSCGKCGPGFGAWVSGGSWSTAEARMILAHWREGRADLAADSMARLVYPYARLFKLDNPITHSGCGPGMYSGPGEPDVLLDVDVFGIPAAFLRGAFGYVYGDSELRLYPRLPPSVSQLQQNFPVRWGELSLFLSLSGIAGGFVSSVFLNNARCSTCVTDAGMSVTLPWPLLVSLNAASVNVAVHLSSHNVTGLVDPRAAFAQNGEMKWANWKKSMQRYEEAHVHDACIPSASIASAAANATAFLQGMEVAGMAMRWEATWAHSTLQSLNATISRCEGRLSGMIPPVPAQPADWAGYKVPHTQQAHVEAFFTQSTVKVQRGLSNHLAAYRTSHDPTERQIYRIWTRATSREGVHPAFKTGVCADIAELENRLFKLKSQSRSSGDCTAEAPELLV